MFRFSILLCIISFSFSTYAQQRTTTKTNIVYAEVTYAYIAVQGKFLSKKIKVNVDLGDSKEQIEKGEQLSERLTNKKSYAAILNYMSELGYELVNTLDLTSSTEGSGGTTGIVYVMKKVS